MKENLKEKRLQRFLFKLYYDCHLCYILFVSYKGLFSLLKHFI